MQFYHNKGYWLYNEKLVSNYVFLYKKQNHIIFSYLHGCDPPIVHGNLNCDTIFIQHNGLMKIGTGKLDLHSLVEFKSTKHCLWRV